MSNKKELYLIFHNTCPIKHYVIDDFNHRGEVEDYITTMLNPNIPWHMQRVLTDRSTQIDPEQRYVSVGTRTLKLEDFISGEY